MFKIKVKISKQAKVIERHRGRDRARQETERKKRGEGNEKIVKKESF